MLEKIKQYRLGFMILLLILIATAFIVNKLLSPTLASNLIQGSGRMDGDLINLNVKYAGRIESLSIEEGQTIALGDKIATLASAEYQAQKAQIEAQIDAKKQELSAKTLEYEMAQKTVPQALIKANANLSITQQQQDELSRSIASQQSVSKQDQHDYERMQNLFNQHLIEKRQVEMSALKSQTSQDTLAALLHKKEQLSQAKMIAQSNVKDATSTQDTLLIMKKGIEALASSLQALEASQTQIEAVLSEMNLYSPIDGVVIEKIANLGEVIGSGSIVVTLLDPQSLYLKIFVDTKENGKLHVGNDAVIFLDAYPDIPIPAKVVRIEQKAEFTPKEVSVPSDRIQRVFALHVKPLAFNPLLKLGIPAVGVVSLDGKGLPVSLKNVPE